MCVRHTLCEEADYMSVRVYVAALCMMRSLPCVSLQWLEKRYAYLNSGHLAVQPARSHRRSVQCDERLQ